MDLRWRGGIVISSRQFLPCITRSSSNAIAFKVPVEVQLFARHHSREDSSRERHEVAPEAFINQRALQRWTERTTFVKMCVRSHRRTDCAATVPLRICCSSRDNLTSGALSASPNKPSWSAILMSAKAALSLPFRPFSTCFMMMA